MSVLINMDMPTSPVLFCIHPDGMVYADLEGGWREYKAVPVPPHGRLGDLDALMLIIQEYIEEYSDTDENGWHSGKWCAMKETEMAINDAPTIIPAEEGYAWKT